MNGGLSSGGEEIPMGVPILWQKRCSFKTDHEALDPPQILSESLPIPTVIEQVIKDAMDLPPGLTHLNLAEGRGGGGDRRDPSLRL